jgi:iron-sulfur cluster assembly protein
MEVFDPDFVLRVTRDRIGDPPRRFSLLKWRYSRGGGKPQWMQSTDKISRIYHNQNEILTRGVVRWGAVIHANTTLFEPGNSKSGAQVVYAHNDDVSLDVLLSVANRCFQLKGCKPTDPSELKIANMLTNELERALDWPIPSSLSHGVELWTTIVMMHREFIPGKVLVSKCFPILVDLELSLAVFIPSYYWEPGFRRDWQLEANDITADWKREKESRKREGFEDRLRDVKQPIILTEAAGKHLRQIMSEQSVDLERSWLRVGVSIGQDYKCMYQLAFENKIHKQRDVAFTSQGVQIVVDRQSLPLLVGTTIDYENRSTGAGFKFHNPNAIQTE